MSGDPTSLFSASNPWRRSRSRMDRVCVCRTQQYLTWGFADLELAYAGRLCGFETSLLQVRKRRARFGSSPGSRTVCAAWRLAAADCHLVVVGRGVGEHCGHGLLEVSENWIDRRTEPGFAGCDPGDRRGNQMVEIAEFGAIL
jgi:hypothetical protein